MKLSSLRFVAFYAATAVAAFSFPVTMTKQEAANLYNALSSIQDGPTPVDMMNIADDMNELFKYVGPFQKGQSAAQRHIASIPDGPGKTATQIALLAPMEVEGDKTIEKPLELVAVDLTAEEVKGLSIGQGGPTKTFVISMIRKFLSSPKQKP